MAQTQSIVESMAEWSSLLPILNLIFEMRNPLHHFIHSIQKNKNHYYWGLYNIGAIPTFAYTTNRRTT